MTKQEFKSLLEINREKFQQLKKDVWNADKEYKRKQRIKKLNRILKWD